MERVKVNKLLVDRGFDPNYYDPQAVGGRCEGKSLGLAFRLIGEALNNPGKEIIVKDHTDNNTSNRYLLDKIGYIIRTNKLEYFTVTNSNCSIRFDIPYVTYEKRWVEVDGS